MLAVFHVIISSFFTLYFHLFTLSLLFPYPSNGPTDAEAEWNKCRYYANYRVAVGVANAEAVWNKHWLSTIYRVAVGLTDADAEENKH